MSTAFLVAGLLAAVAYLAGVEAAFVVVAVAASAAAFVGPRLHRAPTLRPWRLIGTAGLLFLVGAVVRPMVADASGLTVLAADGVTVVGYLVLIAALADLLYARRGMDRYALIDGLIVCAGAAVASTLIFALPTAAVPGRPLLVSVVAGLLPLLDAVVLLLVVSLTFTSAVRQTSFHLLLVNLVLLFVGDIGYAIIGVSGRHYAHPLLDLPFLVAYAAAGAAAVHPSVADMVRATPRPVPEWSLPRLAVILPSVAAPLVLTAVLRDRSAVADAVLAAGGAVIVALLILRAVAAVRGHAAALRRSEYQATHDPLTGLPNRRVVTATVDRLLAAPAPGGVRVWLYYLDLDGFKFVNDNWGHPAGDRLIVDVGARLRAALPADAMVARVGGDEFVIVRRCAEPAAHALAEQIMGCVVEPLRVDGVEVVVSASMGIAGLGTEPGGQVTADSLMRDADTAMYRSKAEGRGGWTVFDASMRQAVRDRIDIEVALRAAVAQEQLTLAYQPIVDLATGRPVGAEALVRWEHPVRGAIGPAVFIPIAEDANLIAELGEWVLRRAVRQLATWRAVGVVDADFTMSVNVSPRQLTDAGFARRLAAELADCRLPADRVVLEITESVMVDGSEVTERVLVELRRLGARISVDDFGTGFSALGYLRRHPVTGVKVDRSFVSGLGSDTEDEEIVRAVAAMSAALGLTVVAEGVETREQREVLAGLGITLGQGWLWGRAVDPQEFAETWALPDGAPAAPEGAGTVRAAGALGR